MSLLIHVPLISDNHNQGLLNVTPTNLGTVSYIAGGKLGKCLSAGNSSQTANGISYDTNLVNELGTEFSCAAWVKPLGNHIHYDGAIISSGNWNSSHWSFGLSQDNSKVSVFGNGHSRYLTCSVPTNTWTHLCCTSENGVTKLYKNGEYVGQTTLTSPLNSDATSFTIGRETYAGGYFSFNGNLNDVRIYNHALSPKEIEILSRGLVAHYPLCNNGNGQANLLKNSNFTEGSSGSQGYNFSATWAKQTDCMKITSTDATAGLYTANYDSVTTGDMATFSAYVKADASMTIYIGVDGSGIGNCESFTIGTSWQRISISKAKTTNNANLRVYGNGTFYVRHMKYELGFTVTPWCPNSADSIYSSMGYDSTTEYDVSGYGNNGVKHGSLSYNTDTPRYSVSTLTPNGVSDYISAPVWIGDNKNITMSMWMKSTDGSTGTGSYHILLSIDNDDYEFSMGTGGLFRHGFRINSSRYVGDYGTTNCLDKKWHMLTATYDGSNIKRYVDGELVNTTAVSGTLQYTGSRTLAIGKFISGTTYGNKNILTSDVRIYATALSADDVKELYQTAASISKNGILFGYELVEG